jgi:Uma2 family endonuclease
MLTSVTKPITARDFMELPEGPPYYQLIEGDLYTAPSPDLYHQDIAGNIYFHIRLYLAKRRVGTVHIAPSDVQLSELNVYEPDVYFVANSRKSILTRHGAEGAPNLVVEVLSPRTAKLDKGAKRAVYARTGVEEMWIIDPDAKRVHVYRLGDSAEEPAGIFGIRQKFESPLFPGLKISVAKIFQK